MMQFLKKSRIISSDTIERIVCRLGGTKLYARQLVHYLLKRGKLYRLAKGQYTTIEDASLLVLCLQPAYLGLQHALSMHGLWEQETIPIIITTRSVRQGFQTVFGMRVHVRRIQKRYFFGIEYHQQGDVALPYSDIEKTFIDMLYFREYLDIEVFKEFRRRIDRKKLRSYLKHYPKRFRKRVLAVLAVNDTVR